MRERAREKERNKERKRKMESKREIRGRRERKRQGERGGDREKLQEKKERWKRRVGGEGGRVSERRRAECKPACNRASGSDNISLGEREKHYPSLTVSLSEILSLPLLLSLCDDEK